VLRLVMGMVAAGSALCVPGNHENKLGRHLKGRKVTVAHGLAETLDQLAREEETDPGFTERARVFIDSLISHYVLDGGGLVVSHAGLPEKYHGRTSGRVRSHALYGDTTGETDEFGLPVRYPWAEDYRGRAAVVYGHTPIPRATWVNNTICLDTGCVFGGKLTALRYPEKQLVSVPAERVWYESVKPFPAARQREPDDLDLTDVLGKRVIETTHHGRITIREENAAGALEVMSRFALHPRWLLYLPPTMSPCATSERPDLLEHPQEAFDGYRNDGIARLICEEKHMGSRAVALVCRDAQVAGERFGATEGASGAVYTRTGRSFFGHELTEQLLGLLRGAIADAGLWAELDAQWLLFDGELLPWSAKAEDLLRQQYAAVGAAARSSLPAATDALQHAADRGLDVTDLLARTRARAANAEAFAGAYRRYVWPTDGLTGVGFAPFQLLAGSSAGYHDRDHLWHLAVADRLAAASPELLQTTRRVQVDTDDPESVAAATRWWEDLTAAGGEGMVVKPLQAYAKDGKGRLVQPGVKVRGREYLRIIYGPE
ncbi:MAG: polynucleotide kinase-phosphatase, partial [Thermocrispum sp.]